MTINEEDIREWIRLGEINKLINGLGDHSFRVMNASNKPHLPLIPDTNTSEDVFNLLPMNISETRFEKIIYLEYHVF